MAGTDKTITDTIGPEATDNPAPAIVLIHPQLGENIGMVARAMLNCGLTELRLVEPRDGWPNEAAINASAGADVVLENAKIFETTEEAIADLERVYATTARPRDMVKDVMIPRAAAKDMREFINDDGKVGVLMGREAKGLNNKDIALSDVIIQVPLNPGFCSLNLAQAVLLVGYEWFQAVDKTPDQVQTHPRDTRPANKEELVGLFEHLEDELDEAGFLYPPEKRPAMVVNIRNVFQRAQMTEQEVRTFRGVVAKLSKMRKKS